MCACVCDSGGLCLCVSVCACVLGEAASQIYCVWSAVRQHNSKHMRSLTHAHHTLTLTLTLTLTRHSTHKHADTHCHSHTNNLETSKFFASLARLQPSLPAAIVTALGAHTISHRVTSLSLRIFSSCWTI